VDDVVWWRAFIGEQAVYGRYVIGIARPGREVPVERNAPELPEDGVMSGWTDEDYTLLVDEGQRQIERQIGDLNELRGRAQLLLTVSFALIGLEIAAVRATGWWLPYVLALGGLLITAYGAAGAAALLVVRTDLDVINATVLATYERPPAVLEQLASDYAAMVHVGENTVATRVNVFRFALVWMLAGGAATGVAYLI
jgi:hypothetical protein